MFVLKVPDAMLSPGVQQPNSAASRALVPRRDRMAETVSYYDGHADAYAVATMAIDTSTQVERFAAMLPSGGRVLDAGCGAGRDLRQLAALGLDPVGIDISATLVSLARRSGVPVKVADFRSHAFEPQSFDGIWAMASLLHLERWELSGVLSSFSRMLRPGGVLFASVKRGSGDVRDETGRWFTLYDEETWSGHLRSAGLEVIEVVGEPASAGDATGTVSPGWISSLARML
jgi:SAM-dependent methyltransferase